MKLIYLIIGLMVSINNLSYGNLAAIHFYLNMPNDSTVEEAELKYPLSFEPSSKHKWEMGKESSTPHNSPIFKGIQAMKSKKFKKANEHFHSLEPTCLDKGVATVNDGVAHYHHDYNLVIPMRLFYRALNTYQISQPELLYNIALSRLLKGNIKNASDTLSMLVESGDMASPFMHYNAGILYALMGIDQKAVNQFELALQYDPHKKEALQNLAWLYLKNNNREGLSRVLAHRTPQNVSMLLLQGEVFMQTQEYSKALQCFTKAHQKQVGNSAPLIGMAKALIRQGQWQKAQYSIQKASALTGGDDLSIGLFMAAISMFDGRYEDALTQYYGLIGKDEKLNLKAITGAGMALCEKGDFFKADSIFGVALEIDPKYVPALYGQGQARFLSNEKYSAIKPLEAAIASVDFPQKKLAHLMLGLAYAEDYEPEKALEHLIMAEGSRGGNQATLCLQVGCILYEQEKYREALHYFDRLVDLEPNNSVAYNNRGNTHFWIGNYVMADADFQKAVQLDPSNQEAWNGLGLSRNQLRNYKGSIIALQKAIKLDSTNAWYHSNLGRTYRETGESFAEKNQADSVTFYFRLAYSEVEKAILLDSGEISLYNNKGFALMSLKQEKEALDEFRRYSSQAALNNIAVYHAQRGELDLALSMIEKAVARDSTYSVPRYNRLRIGQELSRAKICRPCERIKIERLREQEPLTSPFEDKYISIWYIHTENQTFEKLDLQPEVPLPDLPPVFAPAKINFQVLPGQHECEARKKEKNRRQVTSYREKHSRHHKHNDCFDFKKNVH